VNANLESAIYAYSRAKGLFAGVALDGAVIDLDDSMNKKVYSSDTAAKDVLNGRVHMTAADPFMAALDRIVRRRESPKGNTHVSRCSADPMEAFRSELNYQWKQLTSDELDRVQERDHLVVLLERRYGYAGPRGKGG